jgi:hypothetical protein
MSVVLTKEIAQGAGAKLTAGVVGQGGGLEYTRVWKVLLQSASDDWDVYNETGVKIGDVHPASNFAVCTSIETKPDGDSRLAWIVTANYTATAAASLDQGSADSQEPDEGSKSPEQRYANWTTSTTTYETPSWWWIPQFNSQWGPNGNLVQGTAAFAKNPAGDMVEGLTIVQPIVNISVEQFVKNDQTKYSQYVGMVNSNVGKLGSLDLFERSVLFRGVSFKPHIEQFGKKTWRGWLGTFEFSYKYNYNNYLGLALGWDIALPISGYNIINNGLGNGNVEQGALHLELTDAGSVKGWPNAVALAAGTQGKKLPANVLLNDRTNKVTQRSAAMPVALNVDGTPRKATLDPLVFRFQMYKDFNMTLLGLRFRN